MKSAVTFNDLYKFDPFSLQWAVVDAGSSTPGKARPSPRYDHGFAELDGLLYVFAGWDGTIASMRMHCPPHRVLCTHTRSPCEPAPPAARAGVHAVNDLWRYDPSAAAWRLLAAAGPPPTPRYFSGLAAAGDSRLYIFGGASPGEPPARSPRAALAPSPRVQVG